jgi:eukaryotic-like serine/threonine-protein kinase
MPQLDRYRIGEVLGEGGIGRVHAAYDTVLGRDVAIKSLRPARVSDPGLVERFRTEATNLARLDHPHVTTVFDLIEHGRSLYIVMERVHGPTLEQMLRQRPTGLDVAKSIAIFEQAADGLAYAHSKGVIHRDIKPANIMITSTGLVKIMDFGIARLRDSQRVTRDGQIIGTLAYMAPEQLRGEPADERSDLYSLAMVLYEMLTGSPPFKATSDHELFKAQLNAKPRRLCEVLPGINPRIDAALSRALAKKPSQRFASIAEFRDALDADSARRGSRGSLHRTMQVAARAWPSAHAKLSDISDKLVSRLGSAAMRAHLERIPAKRRLPLMVGATTLIATLIVWGALMLNQRSVAAIEPAAPTRAPMPEIQRLPNSSILPEPELHAGRMK